MTSPFPNANEEMRLIVSGSAWTVYISCTRNFAQLGSPFLVKQEHTLFHRVGKFKVDLGRFQSKFCCSLECRIRDLCAFSSPFFKRPCGVRLTFRRWHCSITRLVEHLARQLVIPSCTQMTHWLNPSGLICTKSRVTKMILYRSLFFEPQLG